MRRIVAKIVADSIEFSIYRGKHDEANLNNTNVIDIDKIVFSDIYISDNIDLVAAFFQILVLKREIKNVKIKNDSIIELILNLIKYIPKLTDLYLVEDKIVTYETIKQIMDNHNITYLNAYNMTIFLFDQLNLNHHVKIELRSNELVTTNFTKVNNLNTFSDVYYKTKIKISAILYNGDLEQVENFFQLCRKLKTIEIEYSDYKTLIYLIKLIEKYHLKKIRIFVVQVPDNQIQFTQDLDMIGKISNKLKYNNKIKIQYSKAYLEKNYIKQLNLNILKALLIIIILEVAALGVLFYYKRTEDMEKQKYLEEAVYDIMDNQEVPTATVSEKKKAATSNSYNKLYSTDFTELLKINSDTVGWVKVNNTNVNYPFVQTKDNKYYLNHTFDKKNNINGWVFADYRNNMKDLDKNTILYAHDTSGIMFGGLKKTLKKSWYSNSSNQIITFRTLNGTHQFRIFSIYTIETTTDYLATNFHDIEDYQGFLDKLKNRSIYDFGVTPDPSGRILTLSTCHNSNKRLVIHATMSY